MIDRLINTHRSPLLSFPFNPLLTSLTSSPPYLSTPLSLTPSDINKKLHSLTTNSKTSQQKQQPNPRHHPRSHTTPADAHLPRRANKRTRARLRRSRRRRSGTGARRRRGELRSNNLLDAAAQRRRQRRWSRDRRECRPSGRRRNNSLGLQYVQRSGRGI